MSVLTRNTIDRHRLVTRHNPQVWAIDAHSPLSLGNGEFAFTADATGLQSFPAAYENGIPLCTLSHWGWHSFPPVRDAGGRALSRQDLRVEMLDTHGRPVPYSAGPEGQEELYEWVRRNPHRLHLGRIGLRMTAADGRRIQEGDIADIHQVLDLWTGILESCFTVEGLPVRVKTVVHPRSDTLAVKIESPLIAAGRLAVEVAFPYANTGDNAGGSGNYEGYRAVDWSCPEKHTTVILERDAATTQWLRCLDDTTYCCTLVSVENHRIEPQADHHYLLHPAAGQGRFAFSCLFSPTVPRDEVVAPPQVSAASARHWNAFWTEGGAVELSGSTDPRALELERRIVLSQYVTAISAGSLPPQETGLTCNSWFGKFHLEMHWWHAAHFPMWNRTHLLERSMWWYQSILPKAKHTARSQGYEGARWPKMVGPDGSSTVTRLGETCVWQQPHPISFAEFCYRTRPTLETLQRYHQIVVETADFMASFAVYDEANDRFVLGPPLNDNVTREIGRCVNPPFELEYWVHGLTLARQWCERLGRRPNPKWDEVVRKISRPPGADGVYMHHENTRTAFADGALVLRLNACGMLPGRLVDRATMRRTLHRTLKEWGWETRYGANVAMAAMCAARLGEPELALDALMMDTPMNRFAVNGFMSFAPGVPIYLPGNGGLLSAVAMMAAGWSGGPEEPAPGFPKTSWQVASENLHALL